METKQELQQELARLKELVKKTEEKINNALEVGKWYNYEGGLFCFQGLKGGILRGYGFLNYHDKWTDECNLGVRPNLWNLATDQEVEQALIKEAEKRYKVGDKVMCLGHNEELVISNLDLTKEYLPDYNKLWYGQNLNKAVVVFEDGKWAEIIPKPEYKDGDIVVASIGSNEYITTFKDKFGGQFNGYNYLPIGSECIMKSEGAFDRIERYATDEEKELFNNLANPKQKIGDVCKFWDVDEDIFVIGKLNSIDTESQYKFVIADITNAPYYFINATPLIQQQAIDLLFNS